MQPVLLLRAALVLAAALIFSPVNAARFEGSFAGIAYNSRIDAESPDPGQFDGETVTGTFRFDTANQPEPAELEPGRAWTIVRQGSLELSFNAAGLTSIFVDDDQGPSSTLLLESSMQEQRVTLGAEVLFPYYNATLTLVGPLFDGLNLGTLRPGEINLKASSASFFAGRSFGADVRLTDIAFVNSVPEPGTWMLLLCGLAVLATRVAKRGRASRRCSSKLQVTLDQASFFSRSKSTGGSTRLST